MLDILTAELERLYDLDQLSALVTEKLALNPEQLRVQRGKAALVKTLVEHAAKHSMVEALVDTVASERPALDSRLLELRRVGYLKGDAIQAGGAFGPYAVEARLGDGPDCTVFRGRLDGHRFRVRVPSARAASDRAAVARYLATTRAVAGIRVSGLPENVTGHMAEDGSAYVAHELTEGVPLLSQMGKPTKLRNAWPVLRAILEPLAALHARRLAHGALHPNNVLVLPNTGETKVLLLDAGTHYLRRGVMAAGGTRPTPLALPLRYAAPEQMLGDLPTPRSDVYAIGLLLYALITGKPAFPGTPREVLRQRFSTVIEPLSFVAPRGWVGPDLDELMLQMLDDAPEKRPPDAESVLDMLETIAGYSAARDSTFPDADFDSQVERLLAEPQDAMTAAVLEASIDQGADARRVAEAFRIAAEQIDGVAEAEPARRRLLNRAGSLYENVVGDVRAAVNTYKLLLASDRHDPSAWTALEGAYKRLGNYDALSELLLEHAEAAEEPADRARLFAKLGDLLSTKLSDTEQARIAYTHALVEDPHESEHADAVERLTGSDRQAWGEVLDTCARSAAGLPAGDRKNALLTLMAGWYERHLGRPDLALQCSQAILMYDPADDVALERVASIYRQAQQWRELAEVLLLRADAALLPSVSRDLRVEAAGVRAAHLGDVQGAIHLYEQVLSEDPGHADANRALASLYLRSGDLKDYVRVMRRRSSLSGEHRLEILSDLAKVHAEKLGEVQEAVRIYEQILEQSPDDLEALHQLDNAYEASGQHDRLLPVIERKLALAVTPRQKVSLLERIARLHAREFLNPDAAAGALEQLLDVEPTHEAALAELSRIYRELGRWESLAVALEKRVERTPDERARKAVLHDLGEVVLRHLSDPERAIDVYERIVSLDPNDPVALDTLASLRSQVGDEARAAEALDALAAKEPNAKRQAEHLIRAGEIFERRGDPAAAIARYRHALEAVSGHLEAIRHLGRAYEARGDLSTAMDVLQHGVGRAQRDSDKAILSVDLATLYQRTGDQGRARATVKAALDHDPTNTAAHVLAGDLEYAAGNYGEAVHRYSAAAAEPHELGPDVVHRTLHRYGLALARAGQQETARSILQRLVAASDGSAAQALATTELAFDVEKPERVRELARDLLERFGSELAPVDQSRVLYWEGESLRRMGKLEHAEELLERSTDADPTAEAPLRSLVELFRSRKAWSGVEDTLVHLLDRVSGDARADLLVELGDLGAIAFGDPTGAAKRYLEALAERPKDRRILLKLVQLHSEEKNWEQLVEDVLRLADLVTEPSQRAKYFQTAARVCATELFDLPRAIELLDQALGFQPDSETLVSEAIELRSKQGDTNGVRALLERQIKRAAESNDRERALRLANELADLHLGELHVDDAIAINEAVLELAGLDTKREGVLIELYASDPVRYLDRAVRLERATIRRDPHRPEPYRMMRKVYAEAKRRDATWACCQVLSALDAAAPDEALFYKRHRRNAPLPEGTRITEDDWSELVAHPDADPAVTRIFLQIQAVVAAERGRPLSELGFREGDALDPVSCPGTLVQALVLAANSMRLPLPLLFSDERATAPLGMARAQRRALILSPDAIVAELPALRASFVAGAHLAYFRSGFYVRTLVPSIIGLKSWMLAAIKLIAPRLPLAAELEGPVQKAYAVLDKRLSAAARDRLAEPVDDLLKRGGRADVAKWIAGVDLTSDRIGFILCDDLKTALRTIEATGDEAAAISASSRARALLEYAVSREYLTLRDRLRLSLDWREMEELDLEPMSVEPSSLEPSSLEPSSLEPSSLEPEAV